MIDPDIVRGLVLAHRERRLMPSSTLEGAIAEVRRIIDKTRRQLQHATEAANDAFMIGIEPAEFGRLTNCHGGIEKRAILIEDVWRQRQHLAELTAAHQQAMLEDLDERARDVSTTAYLRRFVGRLASGMVAR